MFSSSLSMKTKVCGKIWSTVPHLLHILCKVCFKLKFKHLNSSVNVIEWQYSTKTEKLLCLFIQCHSVLPGVLPQSLCSLVKFETMTSQGNTRLVVWCRDPMVQLWHHSFCLCAPHHVTIQRGHTGMMSSLAEASHTQTIGSQKYSAP